MAPEGKSGKPIESIFGGTACKLGSKYSFSKKSKESLVTFNAKSIRPFSTASFRAKTLIFLPLALVSSIRPKSSVGSAA
ncbi:hypothetical protein BpHYR1_012202 [Brachionus plicatilis]|uniref:Uncharacterized protein n=1 Tax=Brachionus plicatilis TaxID=10195 RepID=A0A3M7RE82_BRAPC|nr:hypothetical protein BpHYR1_012202 [Brachionus plicatilis]